MIRTPLRYPGGKAKYYKLFEPYIKSQKFSTFIEPFVGGGSVSINTALEYDQVKYILNDLNFGVYSFWKVLSDYDYSDDFILDNIPLVKYIKELKERFKDNGKALYELARHFESKDLLVSAGKFFILNRVTFSGTAESGGYSENSFKNRFTESSIQRLADCVRLCVHRDFEVYNMNAVELLSKYNNEDVLVYLDPPYYTAKKLYGYRGDLHQQFDHEELKRFLRNRAKFKWFMSYDDCEYVRKAYTGYNLKEVSLQYGMDNSGKNNCKIGKEVIISNFVV